MIEGMSFNDFELLLFAAQIRKRRPKFFDDALCSETGVDKFFPKRGQSSVARDARDVCIECPVQEQCLTFAMDTNMEHGIWGGSTATERKQWIEEGVAPSDAVKLIRGVE